jgi:tetratricopeptide (TPR) repeat protein
MQAIWAYQQDNNRTELSKCLEEIKRTDPDYPPAQTELFNEAIAVKNYKEAREIIANMEKQDPYSIAVYSRKISLALEEEEYEELIELVMDAYKQHPNHYEFVNLRYLIEKDIKNNNKGAIKIMKRYLKRNYNESAISTLTNAYLGLGQLSNALKLFDNLLTNNPIGVGTYYSLAQLYFQLGDYHKAEEVINECIKLAPYIGSYHVFLGDIFSERKQTFKAREAYETGINLYPQNYEAREKLRKIKGMDDIFDTFEKIDVYKAFEEAPVADDYPDDNSILLINAVQTVIYPGGGSQEKHILVAKVFDTKGVDTWKEFTIPVYNNQSAIVEKMEVLKKNGSRIEAERSGAYVVFPNLEEGDAIHLTWKVSNYYSGVLARNFWTHQYFSYMIPVKHTSYSLLVPADLDFNYVQHNLDIEPAITTQGSNKLYVWTTENTPAHKDERYMPRTAEIGSMLYLSSFSSWQDIADWYADLAHAKAKVDFQVTETVEDLFTEKEDLSDMDKVKEIYGFILRNIRYSSVPFLQSALIPRKASRTLSQGQGDCKDVSTLFVAMCKAVGIEATIVLVNSRENGASTMPLPEIGFNHAIAKVELDGKEYYVELTSDNLPFAAGHESLKQAFALSIPLDRTNPLEAGLIDPVTRMSNDLVRECKVTFEGELMRVDKQTRRTGVEAAYFRDIYRDLGNERKEQRMQEMITRQYPKIKLTGLTFDESLHNLEDTLYYTYSYEVPDIFTEVGKMQIFELPWSDKFDSPPFMATEEREFPIELWAYLDVEKYQEKLIIDIPAGKRLADLPKDVKISCKNATYTLIFRKSGNQVIVDRLLTITNDRVMPEDYAAFRQFLGNVVKADKQQLGFTSGR